MSDEKKYGSGGINTSSAMKTGLAGAAMGGAGAAGATVAAGSEIIDRINLVGDEASQSITSTAETLQGNLSGTAAELSQQLASSMQTMLQEKEEVLRASAEELKMRLRLKSGPM